MDKISRIWCFGLLATSFVIYNGVTVRFIYPKIFFMQTWLALGLLIFSFKLKSDSKLNLGYTSISALALTIFAFISMAYSPDTIVSLFGPFWRGTGLVFYGAVILIFFLLKEKYVEDKTKFALGVVYSGYAIASIVFVNFLFELKINKSIFYVIGNVNPLSFWLGVTILLGYLYLDEFKD